MPAHRRYVDRRKVRTSGRMHAVRAEKLCAGWRSAGQMTESEGFAAQGAEADLVAVGAGGP